MKCMQGQAAVPHGMEHCTMFDIGNEMYKLNIQNSIKMNFSLSHNKLVPKFTSYIKVELCIMSFHVARDWCIDTKCTDQ